MRAAEIWVRDGCKSKARALREAGYGLSIVRHPERVFESSVFLDELAKRGINKYGMKGNMSWEGERVDEEDVLAETTSEFDVSKIPQDQIAWLKEELDKLP